MTAKPSPSRTQHAPFPLPPGVVAFIASLAVLSSVLYAPMPEPEALRRRRVDATRRDLQAFFDELRND